VTILPDISDLAIPDLLSSELRPRDVRFDHLGWIDDAVEFLLRHEAELQRGSLQREVVVYRVV